MPLKPLPDPPQAAAKVAPKASAAMQPSGAFIPASLLWRRGTAEKWLMDAVKAFILLPKRLPYFCMGNPPASIIQKLGL